MPPPVLPADAHASINTAALPGFLTWLGVFVILAAYAWYLNRE
jgi:hypothetical protein